MRGRGTSGEGREHAVHQHCVQPVQIAEVVKRDALVDKETEFFAALNAALGIGRDDAPWQWALNSGNARLARIAQQPSATGQQRRKSRTQQLTAFAARKHERSHATP
ncbi:hypothetical protein ERJ75_001136600 [Trypanosoma vivax]|nr:hypothetical protein ERJ75_001136600 [Trypanosoma vivax]